jgi:hypothetical protein
MDDNHPQIHYTDTFEKLLKKSAEEFQCLAKAHSDSQRWTASSNTRLSIPVIILSGLAGLGAVGSENLLPFNGAQTLVGMISFVCATLQTISAYFSFAKRSEAHRQATIQYSKLHQLISFELSLPRRERIPAHKLLELLKDEAGRLLETAPQFPLSVVNDFKKAYGSETQVAKPSSLNGLEEVRIVGTDEAPPTTPASPLTQIAGASGIRIGVQV